MASDDSSILLVVEKLEVVLVKPSKPTPDVSLSLSTIDNNPSYETIVKTICVFAPNPNLKDQAMVSLLQHGLSQALFYYYPLAGKLHRKSEDNRLELNYKAGDGVPFIKASATCTLSSLSYLEGTDHFDASYQLVPCYEPVKDYDPLALQVTKFACGGMAIGMAHAHAVCDGVGVAQFFRAMIDLAFGRKTQPTVIPVWNRERLTFDNINDELGDDNKKPELVELRKPQSSIATSPYKITHDLVREILNITWEDITKLKNIIAENKSKTNEHEKLEVDATTLEVLAAHIWRARSRALKLNPEGTTVLGLGVGIRSIMEPPLPEGYYGNAVVPALVALTARELSKSPLSRVVRLIKDMKREALDKRYVLGKLSEMETRIKVMAWPNRIGIETMLLSDWRQIGLQYDGLVNIIPLISMTRPFICVLLPASKADPGMSGGVRLVVTLPREAMAKFKEEMQNAF
ncbi:hypothetical protein AALP_AA7G057400 [Arabis alpina]|uniref:Uncharacterized protein n=1 Tax=Arabis alpina TaxID=50452 RepID=A0A087GG54_ARAAL|nr:hypothetical protein AALP_AA7G057400 [Arabis alpina]